MFGSPGKKALVQSADRLVNACYNSVDDSLGRPCDKDAVLLACGFLHYAIAYMLQTRRMSQNDLMPVFNAYAAAFRRHAPDHELPVSYLDDTRVLVMQAISQTGGDPYQWMTAYYSALGDQVTVDEGTFLGVLARETMAVRAG